MPLDLEHVHLLAQVPGTSETRLMKTTPAMRIKAEGKSPLWVQGGGVYTEDGKRLRQIPEWFWVLARQCTPAAREECGLLLPEEGPLPQPVEPVAPVARSAPVEPPKPGASYEELAAYLGLTADDDDDDVGEEPVADEEIVLPQVKMWACGDCGASVELRKKGVHVAKHRREAKRGA